MSNAASMRTQPRKSPSCDRCSKKKVRCEDIPGNETCQRCFENQVKCERTAGNDGSNSGRVQCKRACDQCREGRQRCTPDPSFTTPSCVRCLEKGMGEICTFVQDALASASTTHTADIVQHAGSRGPAGEGANYPSATQPPVLEPLASTALPPASAPGSPSRTFWHVVV